MSENKEQIQDELNDSVARRTRIKSNDRGLDSVEHQTHVNLANTLINEATDIPESYEQAMRSPQAEQWKDAMNVEMESLHKNGTWKLVESCDKTPLKTKRVFKTKMDQHGNVERYKTRLVAKGCSQKAGTDYTEIFSPVARFETIRSTLAVVAQKNWIFRQFDIKTAFLNGEIDEEIYMHQPDGFTDGTGRVCRLIKSLYGLKQAARAWNTTFDRFLCGFGLNQSQYDPCLYTSDRLILVLYVNDGLIAAQSGGEADQLVRAMESKFETKTSDAQFYLGLRIERNSHTLKIHQRTYIVNLITKFKMTNCNPVKTPA